MRALAFLVAAALLVFAPLERSLVDAERYGHMTDIMPSDWKATNVWLEAADCALARGAWLAVCEDGKLVPISERAIADDPGHALLLGLWAIATQQPATLVDVARLNTLVDGLGLLALAGLLWAMRAWLVALVLLWQGPVEFLGWMGTSPHWAFIGLVCLAAVLPLALAAREMALLSRRAATAWIVAGVLLLALATLMREAIGLMGLVVTLAVSAVLLLRRHRLLPLLPVLAAAVLAFNAPRAVVAARDAALPMQPAQRLATHGLSHTLYLGLGYVENRWGIRYDDDHGEEIARQNGVVFCSPEYFRLMTRLYLGRWAEDPAEVARIYLAKAWLLLAHPTLHPGPPFGVVLGLALLHLVLATALGAWARIGFAQGEAVEGVAVMFAGLFLAQAMAALPSHNYAMPVNAFVLVLFGTWLEFAARAGWTAWRRRRTPAIN
ncbi:MAG: hypothetical protein LCH95_22730 [Proteobacteria bacterium]|nr:hypothetical protein [Pseudomonadota bacterium]